MIPIAAIEPLKNGPVTLNENWPEPLNDYCANSVPIHDTEKSLLPIHDRPTHRVNASPHPEFYFVVTD